MYAYIKGKLIKASTEHIILENNGIGYQIIAPFNSDFAIPAEGEEILIYTYLNVTESGITLYGFYTEEDKKMFQKMTTVSGIGPKGAISILSTLSTKDIVFAILNDDDKAISKAPGIGPKTARRMIIDLKDKLDISSEDLLLDTLSTDIKPLPESGAISDAIAALCALGYPYQEAARAVKGVESADSLDVETLLSLALKEM